MPAGGYRPIDLEKETFGFARSPKNSPPCFVGKLPLKSYLVIKRFDSRCLDLKKLSRRAVRRFRRRLGAVLLTLALAVVLFLSVGRRVLPRPAVLPNESVYLFDVESGDVLWAQNEIEQRAVASLTKLMTALLLMESGVDLNAEITVPVRLESEFASVRAAGGVSLDLIAGEKIRLIDLLYAMLLPSANDAADVIADFVADGSISDFVVQMNARAQELGCEDTVFSCPHGLYNEGNYSSARDMARIAAACFANETLASIVSAQSYTIPATNVHIARTVESTNPLLDVSSTYYRVYACGMKTGYTAEAGRCFVAFARVGKHTFGLVVLGSTQNAVYTESCGLLDWAAFTQCSTAELWTAFFGN
jgi:D-alanyl-D-alanine carboxypeptidase